MGHREQGVVAQERTAAAIGLALTVAIVSVTWFVMGPERVAKFIAQAYWMLTVVTGHAGVSPASIVWRVFRAMLTGRL